MNYGLGSGLGLTLGSGLGLTLGSGLGLGMERMYSMHIYDMTPASV